MARQAEGTAKDRRRRRKANAKARGEARKSAPSLLEKGLAGVGIVDPLTLLTKVGRSVKGGTAIGIVGLLANALLRSQTAQRELRDAQPKGSVEAVAQEQATVSSALRARMRRQSQIAELATRGVKGAKQRELAMKLYHTKIQESRMARMQQVATKDPGLFKQLAAMVVGSSRPRTTETTERIGPQPTIQELVDSGLFDGGPL